MWQQSDATLIADDGAGHSCAAESDAPFALTLPSPGGGENNRKNVPTGSDCSQCLSSNRPKVPIVYGGTEDVYMLGHRRRNIGNSAL